ncbi:pyridoxamine 5'-phosphate oxidase family protein [Oscillibacter sp.]|jgi:nitroimidazol reductase NimA-like FMN-containing flavoprotein (pyridoxamine 5'-phosphate oxidase superfamily)|uniref:pyridoxamine 5'-phosphate oxidase family protein n=1 Tax=Oscillibacter sp. TaxID=1945593 RepID=UPI0025F4375C|nr:pyridoxamine 5'-phosphate oxidase family protein [Oscillibacter sp.]
MREMRRKDRQVTDPEKIREIIAACDCCRLGLCDHGRAYVVPLDFGFTEQEGRYTFYFHSAREGRKIDLIRQAGWASFEMDAGHEAVPDETACEYTARFQCVMGGGPVTLLEAAEEKRAGLAAVMAHVSGEAGPWDFSEAMLERTQVIRLEAEELTCKVHL